MNDRIKAEKAEQTYKNGMALMLVWGGIVLTMVGLLNKLFLGVILGFCFIFGVLFIKKYVGVNYLFPSQQAVITALNRVIFVMTLFSAWILYQFSPALPDLIRSNLMGIEGALLLLVFLAPGATLIMVGALLVIKLRND